MTDDAGGRVSVSVSSRSPPDNGFTVACFEQYREHALAVQAKLVNWQDEVDLIETVFAEMIRNLFADGSPRGGFGGRGRDYLSWSESEVRMFVNTVFREVFSRSESMARFECTAMPMPAVPRSEWRALERQAAADSGALLQEHTRQPRDKVHAGQLSLQECMQVATGLYVEESMRNYI